MKTMIVVYGTYIAENNTPKCDILTVTDAKSWADHVVNTYKADYDNVFKETHIIESYIN